MWHRAWVRSPLLRLPLCQAGRSRRRELRDLLVARRGEAVRPVMPRQVQLDRASRHHVFHPERDDGLPEAEGAIDLVLHEMRGVGGGREDQEETGRGFDGIEDGLVPHLPGRDVPRRDPAAEPLRLEPRADLQRNRLIVGGVRNEQGTDQFVGTSRFSSSNQFSTTMSTPADCSGVA